MNKRKLPKFNISCKACLIASFALLVLAVLTQIVVTNSVSLKGNELAQLQDRKALLTKDISRLAYEDSNLSSLSYLEVEAKNLGFVEMTGRIYSAGTFEGSSVAVASY